MGTKLHEFHMDRIASRYIFKSGKVAEFFGGVFRTSVESEAEELKKEIAGGVASIWQIAGQEIVDSDDIDPIAVMKRKIIAEYEAEKARSLANGSSNSDTNVAKPAGTGTVGIGAAIAGAATAVRVPAGSINLSKK